MAISLYKTRDMIAALEQIHVPGDFLLTTFVNGSESHTTDTIDIDIVKKGKKMAPFVSPVREGKVITRDKYQTRTHRLPYIKLKRPTTAQEALTRMPGDTVYSGGETAAARANREMGKTLAELDQMIFRREEWMAAQMLQTGKCIIEGEGLSYEIDVGMNPTHLPVLTGGDLWDQSTADIQNDLTTWADLVYDDSGLTATDAILGRNASKAALRNPSFIGALDRRRIDRGEIMIERLPKGVKYFGYDRESGLDLWGYTEKFYDENTDTEIDLIDPDKVVVTSRSLYFVRHYGLIQNVEASFVGPRYPDNWVTKDPSVHWVSLESAPAVILHQPDGVVCATVL